MILGRFIKQRRGAKHTETQYCCARCGIEAEKVDEKLRNLEQRIAEAEKKLAIDRTLELVKVRMDTASLMFSQVMVLVTQRHLETADIDAISGAIFCAAQKSIEQALIAQPPHRLASTNRLFHN